MSQLDKILGRPAVRNALGLHSPTRCAIGAPGSTLADAIRHGLEGTQPRPWSCGCTCRRCKKAHRPDSPPGLVLREEATAAAMVRAMGEAAADLGIGLAFGPIPHEAGSCDECDRRRDELNSADEPR